MTHTADARAAEAPAELDPSFAAVPAVYGAEADSLAAIEPTALAQEQPPRVPPPPPPRPVGRINLKGGWFGADEDALDDGWIAALSWMQFLSPNFATEFELGYLDVDGEDGGIDTELWGIPILFNGRFNLPIGRFELFGGGGLGTIYFDGEADGAVVDVSADGWLTAGDLFAGAGLSLRNGMTLGVEWKRYFTDSDSELDTGLDANAVLLTLGLNR